VGDDSDAESRLSLALSSMARVGTVTDLTLPASVNSKQTNLAASAANEKKLLASHVD